MPDLQPSSSPASRRRALITGASAGIGAEFARQLAASGHALVLCARRLDRLEALAAQLRAEHAVPVDVLAVDLAHTDAVSALCEEMQRRGLDIDVLINNAGYGVAGNLLAQRWQVHADFVQVLLTAPIELCYRLLPGMRARGYGRIVNVASLAGLVPPPAGHTLYAAVKSALIRFSQALALENPGGGVHICALCPGFTYSEFHDVNGTRERVNGMPKWMWTRADVVVRDGLVAVARGATVRVSGRAARMIWRVVRCLPTRLSERLMARNSRYRDAGDTPVPRV